MNKSKFKKFLLSREATVFLFLACFFVGVGLVNNSFLSGETVHLVVKNSMVLFFLAIGEAFVILTGDIDVSVGSIMGMCAAVLGTMLRAGQSVWLAIIVTSLVGIAIGLVNGLGVIKIKIPAIVMTLGVMGAVRGLMLIFTGGKWIENIPQHYKGMSGYTIGGVNFLIWIGFIILIGVQLYLSRTKSGRYLLAVGDNADGAYLVGIPVNKIRLTAFMVSGLCASIAAMIFVMNIGFVPNQTGNGLEMKAVAAAVLGGVSLQGGVGSAVGAVIGAIFLTSIDSALIFLKVPAYWNNTIFGLILLTIVLIDSQLHNIVAILRKKSEVKA